MAITSGGVCAMARTCALCGFQSPIHAAFLVVPKPFSRKKVYYCARCWARGQWSFVRMGLYGFFGLVAVAVLAAVSGPLAPFGWTLINLLLFPAFLVLFVVPHEAAHA